MLAHVGADHLGLRRRAAGATPATLWGLTVDYPGMLLAVAGTVCAGHGRRHQRQGGPRRLRYESWHLLHLYAYLGAGLALPHQLWTGRSSSLARRRRVLVGAVGRGGRRRCSSGASGCRCGAAPGTGCGSPPSCPRRPASCRCTWPAAAWTGCRAEAGQFFTWRFLAGPGWSRAHPYSLSAAPDGSSLRITVKELGDGSADAAARPARHPGPGRGPLRTAERAGPDPAEGRADRCRGRHHAAAGAGRGTGLRPRRRRPAAALHRPATVRG